MSGAWKRRGKYAEPTRAELPKREPIEPTPDERRNGWDAASLTAYRETIVEPEVLSIIMRHRQLPRPTRANSKYDPLRAWASYSPFGYSRRRGR
jgi:hypothetical protein